MSVTDAAKDVGFNKRTAYKWRAADPAFAQAWQAAQADSTAALEREALRRALSGTQKPVYRGGELVGHITEYSDQMLMFLLKRDSDKGEAASIDDQVKGARDTLLGKFAQALAGGAAGTLPRKPDGSGSRDASA